MRFSHFDGNLMTEIGCTRSIQPNTTTNKNRHRIAVAVSLKTNAGGMAGLHFWSSLLKAKA
jgi:hypothetical protein